MNITEGPGERVITGTLDELRDVLPPGEVAELEDMLAELEDATSSPQKLRAWEREARRREAEEQAVLAAYHRLRSRP
jgi:hypothetical protein